MFNLVSNAVKNSSTEKPINLSFILEPNCLKVVVEDFGVGIPPSIIFKLGKPFIYDNKISASQGTGLGLFIVTNIVQAHKGQISFHTHENFGTTVCVQLPLEN